MPPVAAVLFDVDFTLIHPGPRFQGCGYEATCDRYGMAVDPAKFEAAVAGASELLDSSAELYDQSIYLAYTRRVIELMGGGGPAVDLAAREIFDDWNQHHHFSLYDDVAPTLADLRARGLKLGLISNTERCLVSFQSHFSLDGLIGAVVSMSTHGFMKPHPSIFQSALSQLGVDADEAVMVGDSLVHDVLGARRAGVTGVLLARGGVPPAVPDDVSVIRSLTELPPLL